MTVGSVIVGGSPWASREAHTISRTTSRSSFVRRAGDRGPPGRAGMVCDSRDIKERPPAFGRALTALVLAGIARPDFRPLGSAVVPSLGSHRAASWTEHTARSRISTPGEACGCRWAARRGGVWLGTNGSLVASGAAALKATGGCAGTRASGWCVGFLPDVRRTQREVYALIAHLHKHLAQ